MMEELVTDIDNRIQIPRRHRNAKILTIRMPYQVRLIRGRSIQVWFRHKGEKDSSGKKIKPYVPEGFIEINKERFKVIEPDWSMLGCIKKEKMTEKIKRLEGHGKIKVVKCGCGRIYETNQGLIDCECGVVLTV